MKSAKKQFIKYYKEESINYAGDDDINQAIIELKNSNIEILNDEPSIGAEGFKIVFIHPKATGGVLVELAEKPS